MKVRTSKKFENALNKIKDAITRERILKQTKKICENPKVGKPLQHGLKGERTLYIKPYRLIYAIEDNCIKLLRFEHRDKVYK